MMVNIQDLPLRQGISRADAIHAGRIEHDGQPGGVGLHLVGTPYLFRQRQKEKLVVYVVVHGHDNLLAQAFQPFLHRQQAAYSVAIGADVSSQHDAVMLFQNTAYFLR